MARRRISILTLGTLLTTFAQPTLAENKVRPGLGDDPGVPETTPFALPPGLALAGPIWGVDADGGECPGVDAKFGTDDGGVKVCVPLKNTSGAPRPLDLNDGLILIQEHQDGQNGLLVERVLINVPPSGGEGGCRPVEKDGPVSERKCEPENGDPDSVYIVQLNLRCLNEGRSPSFSGMAYQIGGVTADPDLLALANLLATKDLSSPNAQEVATEAVYEITEGSGLTTETRRRVNALPARKQA